ncbi:MAG: ABC transporter ATP-binding protein [Spirochaetaceae bacterium]
MRASRVLFDTLRGSRAVYVAAVVCVGIAALFGYAPPLMVRFAIDSVIGTEPVAGPDVFARLIERLGGVDVLRANLWMILGGIVAVTVVSGVFSFLQGRLAAGASESFAERLRNRLYDHIQNLSYDYHVHSSTGDLLQRCTSDVETVRRFMAIQFVEVGRALFMVVAALPVLFTINVRYALASIAAVPVVFAFSLVFFGRVQRTFQKVDEADGRLSTVLQESLTGVRVVRAFGRQRFEADRFDERSSEYRDLVYRLIRQMAAYWSLSDLLCLGQIGVIVVYGTALAVSGAVTIGTVLLFVTVVTMLLFPIRQMGRVLADMGRMSVALKRIGEILAVEIEHDSADAVEPEIRGHVVFDHVSFAYAGRQVLKDVSFEARPGTTVALLGPTGSGKSTLVQLLSRLYDYEQGSIRIDGVELRSIRKRWIRQNVGFVLQEPFMFAKSIRENIRLARSHSSESDVHRAAETAAVHDVIESFDRGYETPVGERGVTLSGGQKQRVAIARALLMKPPILVFDDSLSAVDTETDARIRSALTRARHGATTFIVSHRLTTLSEADCILVLDDGRIVQSGTHQQLLAQEGMYSRLWNMQRRRHDEFEQELLAQGERR